MRWQVLGAMTHRVSEAVMKGTVEAVAHEAHQWLQTPRKANEAFATLLTTANVEYFRGALVLGSSIRSFDSARDLIALVTSSVPMEWHSALAVAGWTVVPVCAAHRCCHICVAVRRLTISPFRVTSALQCISPSRLFVLPRTFLHTLARDSSFVRPYPRTPPDAVPQDFPR